MEEQILITIIEIYGVVGFLGTVLYFKQRSKY